MLELGVLLAQLPELTQFAQSQSPILLLPDVVRRLADPVLTADVGHPGAALRLSQCSQDLFLRMSLLRHLRVLLVLARGPRLPLLTQLARGSLFGFWVSTISLLIERARYLLGNLSAAEAGVASFHLNDRVDEFS